MPAGVCRREKGISSEASASWKNPLETAPRAGVKCCHTSRCVMSQPVLLIRVNSWFKSGKPILRPRISRVRVTARFPETQNVAVEEKDFADELRSFPGVTLRDDHARRTAMLFRQRFAVPLVRNDHVVVHADLEWIVRRVTVVALEEDVCGFGLRFHEVGNSEECHSLPFPVELGPGGDAMKVAYVFELRQREELLPVQRDRVLDQAVDFQLPFVERDFRLKA